MSKMDTLAFDITKLNEMDEEMKNNYEEYKEIVSSLDFEIKELEKTWGTRPKSLYTEFREKYEEKKGRLVETEVLMKELVDQLDVKKQEIENATIQSENEFE